MRKMACLVLIAFSSGPSPAFAQDDFRTRKVSLGQTVDVTTGGTTIRGAVNELSSTAQSHRRVALQSGNTSWVELKQAADGRAVTVRPRAGGDVEGTIVSVDENQLIIAGRPRQSLSKSQVCRVTIGANRHLGRAILIGAGTLAGLMVGGLIRGFVTDDPHDHSPAIFAAAGGALGAVIPFRTTRILYESPDC
jgi:hypothetical protein